MQITRGRRSLLAPALVLVLLVGAAACDPRPPTSFDYGAPSPAREVGAGTLLGVAGGLRLLRVEGPAGSPGCEGAPRPQLRLVGAEGEADGAGDPAPGITLSAGGNRLFSRPGGEGWDRDGVGSGRRGTLDGVAGGVERAGPWGQSWFHASAMASVVSGSNR